MWYYQPADLQPQQNGLTHNGLTHNAMNGSAQTQVQPATLAWPGPLPAPLPAQDPRTAGGTVTANVTARPAAQAAAPIASPPLSAPPMTAAPAGSPERTATGPLPAAAANKADQADQAPATGLRAGGALSKLTGTVRGRRAARKPRLAMSAIFADLVDLAHLPRSAYAVDEEVTGAMCLFKTEGGYEVFSCAEDARHEVRFFEDEEAAYFYLFGVLAAEALRNGRLSPRQR